MNFLPKISLAAMLLAAAVLCRFAPDAKAQTDDPTILIHSGKHFIWYTKQSIWNAHQSDIAAMFDYMDMEFGQAVSDWGVSLPREQFYFWVDPHTGGGFAAGDIGEIHKMTGKIAPGIGVAYDAYYNMGGPGRSIKAYWAYAIGTHETMNLLTGQALSGGWPRDWWADDISPFPAMSAVRIEMELGKGEISAAHDASFHGDKLYAMFKAIQARYGWTVIHKMLALAKADGVRWDRLDSGHNPSPILTAYVTAYMVLGSYDSLGEWSTRFFQGVVPGYNQELTAKVLAARENWKTKGGDGKAFLNGDCISAGAAKP